MKMFIMQKEFKKILVLDYGKFEDVSYEVFIQRQADIVRSLYLSEQGSKNNQERDTTYNDRSFALVENLKIFQQNNLLLRCGLTINNLHQHTILIFLSGDVNGI